MDIYEDMTAAGDVTADDKGWVHVEALPEKLDPLEAERLARVLLEAATAARAALTA
ncbi:MAG: hypothetical protein H5T76_20955 [Streptomyces sp.]|nr:hypothetical protein [Streptomyces sp.]